MMEMSKYPKINWELAKPNRKGIIYDYFLKMGTANKHHSASLKTELLLSRLR